MGLESWRFSGPYVCSGGGDDDAATLADLRNRGWEGRRWMGGWEGRELRKTSVEVNYRARVAIVTCVNRGVGANSDFDRCAQMSLSALHSISPSASAF
jgi:hypothetical protein